MKLSICMMIKNESKWLEACLNSLKPLLRNISSELIIIDTGSTDASVEIASRYTDKLYHHPWENDFSDMRNKTISYATGEWILIVDGDEVLDDGDSIIDFLNSSKSKNYNTATIKVINILNQEDNITTMMTSHRLFRKSSGIRFEGKVHNQAIYSLPMADLDTQLYHYGYLATDKALMDLKFERTMNILKSELEKDPENIYYLYQLSESYGMHKDYKEALEPVMRALDIIKQKNIPISNYLYVFIGAAKWNFKNENFAIAESILKEIYPVGEGYIDVQCYMGHILNLQNRNEEAIPYIERYIEMVDHFDELPSSKDISVKSDSMGEYSEFLRVLASIYYDKNDYDKAIYYFVRYEDSIQKREMSFYIVDCCLKSRRLDYLYDYFCNLDLGDEREAFYTFLEDKLDKEGDTTLLEVASYFQYDSSPYGILSRVRKSIIEDSYDENLIYEIQELEFSDLASYYGDLVLYMVIQKVNIFDWLKNSYEEELNEMMVRFFSRSNRTGKVKSYIFSPPTGNLEMKIQNFDQHVFDYVNHFERSQNEFKIESLSLEQLKVMKTILRYPLAVLENESDLYEDIFMKYIHYGKAYISRLYSEEIIDSEKLYHLRSEEHGFLLYLYKACKIKEIDQLMYVKYLKKALNIFELKRGVELLLNSIENISNSKNSEMDELKAQLKGNIHLLIQGGQFNEAQHLIEQYLSFMPMDEEILYFRSEIMLNAEEGLKS